MFVGEGMQQMFQCFGEFNMLCYDFVIVERVYYNDKIEIGVNIEFVMNK